MPLTGDQRGRRQGTCDVGSPNASQTSGGREQREPLVAGDCWTCAHCVQATRGGVLGLASGLRLKPTVLALGARRPRDPDRVRSSSLGQRLTTVWPWRPRLGLSKRGSMAGFVGRQGDLPSVRRARGEGFCPMICAVDLAWWAVWVVAVDAVVCVEGHPVLTVGVEVEVGEGVLAGRGVDQFS